MFFNQVQVIPVKDAWAPKAAWRVLVRSLGEIVWNDLTEKVE